MGRFDQTDWGRLYKVLLVAARVASAKAPQLFDCGLSADDLVGETLATYFASETGLGWKPKKGTLERFLVGVMKHKAIDHLRRQKHVGGSLDDGEHKIPEPTATDSIVSDTEYAHTRDKLYALVDGDPELRDLIAAVDLISGKYNVNQELAEILNRQTTQDVVNLKRRLVNTPGVRELFYGEEKIARRKIRR